MDINKLAEKTVELICKEYQLRWPKGVLRPMVELIQDAIEEAVVDQKEEEEDTSSLDVQTGLVDFGTMFEDMEGR